LIRDIEVDVRGARSEAFRDGTAWVVTDIPDNDLRTVGHEPTSSRFTDAAPGAAYDRDLALQRRIWSHITHESCPVSSAAAAAHKPVS
jgi:hypothetical protein